MTVPGPGGPTSPREPGGEPYEPGGEPHEPGGEADGEQWHRVHPVTPALRAWKILVVLLIILLQQVGDNLELGRDLATGRGLLLILAVFGGVVLIGFVYSFLAWRMTRYAVSDDAVHLNTGVLFRQQRRARLDRLQAVDVVQPVLARILGLAELKLEVAGGADSGVRLAFLRESEAQALRVELLTRAARLGRGPGAAPGTPGGPSAVGGGAGESPGAAGPVAAGPGAAAPSGVGPGGVVPSGVGTYGAGEGGVHPGAAGSIGAGLPGTGDAGVGDAGAGPAGAGPAGSVHGVGPAGAGLAGAMRPPDREVFTVAIPVLLGSLLRSVAPFVIVPAAIWLVIMVVAADSLTPVIVMVPALFGVVGVSWQRFSREANFRAAISPDGISLHHGLLESRSQTIPPDRVQAVRLQQPVLWRGKDWWRVQVNVAGYGLENQAAESVLLPVGTRDDALLALWLVLPDLGTDDPRGLLEHALSGTGTDGGFTVSPRRARWLLPLSRRRNGYVATGTALLLRSRRLARRLDVVPHARTQSLGLAQGPVARAFGVASFIAHSTPGPITPRLENLDAKDVGELLGAQARRAREARAGTGNRHLTGELPAEADVAPPPDAPLRDPSQSDSPLRDPSQSDSPLRDPSQSDSPLRDQSLPDPDAPYPYPNEQRPDDERTT